jgi:hypothetical protein
MTIEWIHGFKDLSPTKGKKNRAGKKRILVTPQDLLPVFQAGEKLLLLFHSAF